MILPGYRANWPSTSFCLDPALKPVLCTIPMETISELELAADARLAEAKALMSLGLFAGGIYLAGYAAEMTLKYAVFRFEGAGLGDPVPPRLGPAKTKAKELIGDIDPENYHSLVFWALLLRELRRRKNQAFHPSIGKELSNRAKRLYVHWRVNMRYRKLVIGADDAKKVLEDVDWFRRQSNQLWRS